MNGLGRTFLGSGTLYKRWPCVGTAHSHMKAAIDIVQENDLPLDERRAPATLADAKFSLPFLVSVAIARRGMSVSDFSEAGLRDEDVLAIGRKMTLVSDPSLDWKLEMPPGRVEILTHDGRRWLVEGHDVPGNGDNPMTWDDVASKFMECGSVAFARLSPEALSDTIGLAAELDRIEDATRLVRRLAIPSALPPY